MSINKKLPFRGVATALITPFRDGRPDYGALADLIDMQQAAGVSALVIAGTTGEAATLTYREHGELIRFAADRSAVPIIAGVGSNCTRRAVELSISAAEAGADALLAVTPYYNKATPDGLRRHFGAIADATQLPLVLYNVPSRTGVELSPQLCEELSRHPKIVGIKEASGSISTCAEIAQRCGDRLALYSGNDDMTVPVLALGGAGVISVVSNMIPRRTVELYDAFVSGQTDRAAALQAQLVPLVRALFSHVNPVPIKCVMADMGLCREEYRLPLCPLSPDERRELLEAVRPFGSLT